MKALGFSHEQLVNKSQISKADLEQIHQCRGPHNRLGFGYQLSFVRLNNRFPIQQPFEVLDDLLTFVSIQLEIPFATIDKYKLRQPTISEHQESIRKLFLYSCPC